MKEIKFNLNWRVKFKLNPSGEEELKLQHERLRDMYPFIGEFKPWVPDEEGYHTLQFHDLMNRFGHLMYNRNDCPIDTNVILIEQNW